MHSLKMLKGSCGKPWSCTVWRNMVVTKEKSGQWPETLILQRKF